jgi:hypothetical protein
VEGLAEGKHQVDEQEKLVHEEVDLERRGVGDRRIAGEQMPSLQCMISHENGGIFHQQKR